MSGETSAEMTIVVRAQDAATTVINGIGAKITGVFLKPLGYVLRSAQAIFKQFFSLKALLTGGGIIAVFDHLSQSLQKNAKDFEPIFSTEVQTRIDDTASAFNKLGASLKAMFGNIIAEVPIDRWLNNFSDWLRDHKEGIIQGFQDIGTAVGKAVDVVKQLSEVWHFYASGEWEKPSPKKGNAKGTFSATEGLDDMRTSQVRTVDQILADKEREAAERGMSGMSDAAYAAQKAMIEYENSLKSTTQATIEYGDQNMSISDDMLDHLNIVREVQKAYVPLDAIVHKTADEYEQLEEATNAATQIFGRFLTVGDAASSISDQMTNAFEGLIQGTKSVAQAFGGMIVSILQDLSKLLLQRSLFKLFTSLLGGAVSTPEGIDPSTGGEFGAGPYGPGFASGTNRIRRPVRSRVGENGPEIVELPAGARVRPSQRSRDTGGITINVIGARDAKATAVEVMAELRRNASFRQAFA